MELERQVASLELAKRLKELGVEQESQFWWVTQTEKGHPPSEPFIDHHYVFMVGWGEPDRFSYQRIASAFTVGELGEKLQFIPLPQKMNKKRNGAKANWFSEERYRNGPTIPGVFAGTEADARAKLLINLIELEILDSMTTSRSKQA